MANLFPTDRLWFRSFSVTTPRPVIYRYCPQQHAMGTSTLGGGLHRTVNNYILSWFTETYEYSNACTTWYNYTVCRTKTLPSLGLYLMVAVKPSSLNRLRAKPFLKTKTKYISYTVILWIYLFNLTCTCKKIIESSPKG